MLCELFNFTLLKHCKCLIYVFQPYVFIEHCVNDVRAWMNANVCAYMYVCAMCVYSRVCTSVREDVPVLVPVCVIVCACL